jgi:hypothetical protein
MAVLLFAVLWLMSDLVYTAEPPTLHPNPLAEQWVLKQVAADEIADLKKRFPKEADSPPYIFFLLNGDMELYRNRHFFV